MRTSLLVTLVLLAGCRHRPEAGPTEAEIAQANACRSQPLVLMPWSIDSALVEENEYRHLVKEVSDEIGLGLRDRVGKLGKFERVVAAAECTSGVRVESRVVSLIHHHRQYHFKVAGRVIECGTERQLHSFELEEESKEVASIAGRLADNITSELEEKVVCSRAAATQADPPPPPPPNP